MGVEEILGGRRHIRVVTPWFCFESGEQKCLKAEYKAIKYGWQDKAKRKYNGRKITQGKPLKYNL